MPSLKRGFLFQYFDKIICGVVGLVLLAGLAYALSRAGSLPKDIAPAVVNQRADAIQQKLQAPATPLRPELPSVVNLGQVSDPRPVRPDMAIWDLPVEYPPIKVGLIKEFILQFRAPLGEGTVVVQAIDPVIEIVQHPVDGDYSKVKVRSKSYEGQAAVVGSEARVHHIYPIIVDSSVNKTAYPPTLQVTSRQGTVTLKLVEDPKIVTDDVEVFYYEIWRRAWSDPLGKYEVADEVEPSGKSFRAQPGTPAGMGAPGAPYGMAPVPAAPARGGRAAAPEVPGIAWQDKGVKPGEYYSYKVRTVGGNTFPTEGDFCEPLMVEVLPDTDFKFVLNTPDSAQFAIIKATGPQSVQKENFWAGAGDQIGGQMRGTTSPDSYYGTTNVLVDLHPMAVDPNRPVQPGRVIYADETGNLHVLWRNETKADVLWEREKAAAAGAAGRMMSPFGPMGPMP